MVCGFDKTHLCLCLRLSYSYQIPSKSDLKVGFSRYCKDKNTNYLISSLGSVFYSFCIGQMKNNNYIYFESLKIQVLLISINTNQQTPNQLCLHQSIKQPALASQLVFNSAQSFFSYNILDINFIHIFQRQMSLRPKLQKDSLGYAIKLKSKFIEALKQSPSQSVGILQHECQQLLEDIKTNTEILNQIKFLDEQILRLQIEIAETPNNYDFVQSIQREHGQYDMNQGSNQLDNSAQTFLQQRDLRSRLLSHLKVVQKTLNDVGYEHLLGIPKTDQTSKQKQLQEPHRRHFSIIDSYI